MENQPLDFDQSEEISESFLCCVCLDLLYKPIVLSCGHVSCFWCVHNSMDSFRASHCPICRQPYYHFPTVCQMLLVVLMKLYPLSHKRREQQTLEEEKEKGIYSPQFDYLAYGLYPKQELKNLSNPALPCPSADCDMCPDPPNNSNWISRAKSHQSESSSLIPKNDTNGFGQIHNGNVEVTQVVQLKEGTYPRSDKCVSLDDVLCAACNQMLFRPAVFNCGHVVCEGCIVIPAQKEKLLCQVCLIPHPSGPPKVCLELDHFLEKEFPQEYSARRSSLQLKPARVQLQDQRSSTDASKTNADSSSIHTRGNVVSQVHIGVGCDSCGRLPIVGDRYKCKDCKESIGFDLCKECYDTRSKLPGRFNQQHTEEHRLELVELNMSRRILFRMLTERRGDAPAAASVPSENASGNPEIGSLLPSLEWVVDGSPGEFEGDTYILEASHYDENDEDDGIHDDML